MGIVAGTTVVVRIKACGYPAEAVGRALTSGIGGTSGRESVDTVVSGGSGKDDVAIVDWTVEMADSDPALAVAKVRFSGFQLLSLAGLERDRLEFTGVNTRRTEVA